MGLHEIRDPVYGFIQFNDFERDIIAHSAFQRLRRIKQLALTNMVYPGAGHSRFEHSLGVMHLASRMFDSIFLDRRSRRLLEDKLGYKDDGIRRDRQIIRLAALLHDIGHAPFGHVAEDLFPKREGQDKRYSHEDYSCAIIRNILKDTIENNRYNKSNCQITADMVASVIEGNPITLEHRLFWKDLISGQLDADRGDYCLRDSYHIGVKYGVYDLDRLIITTTLGVNPEDESLTLGIRDDGWHVAESLILARYQVYSQIIYHKKKRAYDLMLERALGNLIEPFSPPTSIENLESFLKVDDYRVWNLMLDSTDYWSQAICSRKHLKCVHEDENIADPGASKAREIKDRLDEAHIENFCDSKEAVWYTWNSSVDEIMIINQRGYANPLSSYSPIINNLEDSLQARIYVKPEDLLKAGEILGRVAEV